MLRTAQPHSESLRIADEATGEPEMLSSDRIYEYPRYCFSNVSGDIHKIFCEHLDLLGVRYTRASPVIVQIAQRPSVIVLDSFIGPKC